MQFGRNGLTFECLETRYRKALALLEREDGPIELILWNTGKEQFVVHQAQMTEDGLLLFNPIRHAIETDAALPMTGFVSTLLRPRHTLVAYVPREAGSPVRLEIEPQAYLMQEAEPYRGSELHIG